jgi:hypothetical protein
MAEPQTGFKKYLTPKNIGIGVAVVIVLAVSIYFIIKQVKSDPDSQNTGGMSDDITRRQITTTPIPTPSFEGIGNPTTTPVPTTTPMATTTPRPTTTPMATTTPRPTTTPMATTTPVPTTTPRPTTTPAPCIARNQNVYRCDVRRSFGTEPLTYYSLTECNTSCAPWSSGCRAVPSSVLYQTCPPNDTTIGQNVVGTSVVEGGKWIKN